MKMKCEQNTQNKEQRREFSQRKYFAIKNGLVYFDFCIKDETKTKNNIQR